MIDLPVLPEVPTAANFNEEKLFSNRTLQRGSELIFSENGKRLTAKNSDGYVLVKTKVTKNLKLTGYFKIANPRSTEKELRAELTKVMEKHGACKVVMVTFSRKFV